MADSCLTCFFFRADAGAAPFDGRCRVNAPGAPALGEGQASGWPPVLLADWCGAFSASAPAVSPTWRDYACQINSSTGVLTAASIISARWLEIGKLVTFCIHGRIVTNGAGAGTLQFTLPTIVAFDTSFAGMRNGNLGLMGFALNNTNIVSLTDDAGAYPGIDASDFYLSGLLEQT